MFVIEINSYKFGDFFLSFYFIMFQLLPLKRVMIQVL